MKIKKPADYIQILIQIINGSIDLTLFDLAKKKELKELILKTYIDKLTTKYDVFLSEEQMRKMDEIMKSGSEGDAKLMQVMGLYIEAAGADKVVVYATEELEKITKDIIRAVGGSLNLEAKQVYNEKIQAELLPTLGE